jgi:hypothetical protein
MNQRVEKVHGIKRAVLVDDEERCRLVGGPYEPPFFKGEFLVDEVDRRRGRSVRYADCRTEVRGVRRGYCPGLGRTVLRTM